MSREDDLDLDQDLEHLAKLLSSGGRKPFLERPVVTPEDRWFPDIWTPDLESARVVAARLMAYAGLPELGVECEPLYDPRTFAGTDASSIAASRPEAAAALRDISNGTVDFMIEPRELGRPQRVAEALAREVALAWRVLHDILANDRNENELLTDLTTIVLGFGIITANAAYGFRMERMQGRGVPARLYPPPAGRVGPDRLSALLAIQCLVREEDPNRIRRYLDRERRAAFDEAYRDTDPGPVRERLGLTAVEWEPASVDPAAVEIRPGRTALAVRACSDRMAGELGEEGGFVSTPLSADFSPTAFRHRGLGGWGRPHIGGGWLRRLFLVEDPEKTVQLLILECTDRGAERALALALLPDKWLRSESAVAWEVEPLFESGDLDLILPGELPSFVTWLPGRALDIERFGKLLMAAVARLAPGATRADLARMRAWTEGVRARVRAEAADPAAAGPPPEDPAETLRLWWDYASNPILATEEAEIWGEAQPRVEAATSVADDSGQKEAAP